VCNSDVWSFLSIAFPDFFSRCRLLGSAGCVREAAVARLNCLALSSAVLHFRSIRCIRGWDPCSVVSCFVRLALPAIFFFCVFHPDGLCFASVCLAPARCPAKSSETFEAAEAGIPVLYCLVSSVLSCPRIACIV
jgi:hypothetical protein